MVIAQAVCSVIRHQIHQLNFVNFVVQLFVLSGKVAVFKEEFSICEKKITRLYRSCNFFCIVLNRQANDATQNFK
jgi:hypothetical protein